MKKGIKYEESLIKKNISSIESEEVTGINIDNFIYNSDRRMKRYTFRKQFSEKPMYKYLKVFIAVALFLILCGTMSPYLNIKAVIFNAPSFVVESFDNYIRVRYVKEDRINSSEFNEISILYEPSYIPDNYRKAYTNKNGVFREIIYKSSDSKSLTYTQSLITGSSTVDSKNNGAISISVGEDNIYCNKSDNGVILIWYMDQCEFSLKGNLSIDEMLNIKESLI